MCLGADDSSSASGSIPQSVSSSGKLSANNASEASLKAAFEAAGIPNAGSWAREVDEYRPYSEDDLEFTELRRELAKYNPGPGIVDDIVELLELP